MSGFKRLARACLARTGVRVEMSAAAGRPRMTTSPNPQYWYGNRARQRGLPHDQWVYATVKEGIRRRMSSSEISSAYVQLGMDDAQVARVMKKIRERGVNPLPHGVGRGGGVITDEHMQFLRDWMEATGARKTAAEMCTVLLQRFGVRMTPSGMSSALQRHDITWKRLTRMDERGFNEAQWELTRRFLWTRLALDKRRGVWIDEMQYKAEEVGSNYGYAPAHQRAVQADLGHGGGEAIMFLASMTDEEVLPITFPVLYPATVTGFVFEWWCQTYVIPTMLAKGKTFVVMDNAKVHRPRELRVMFAAVGIRLVLIPPYSPWFQPVEKIFLSTHMKCNRQVPHVRANFLRRVLDVLYSHTPHECAGCVRHTGWI